MRNILNIIGFVIFINCTAQTVSLETMAQCNIQSQNCPAASYVKDINNSLNKYVGTWKGTLNGKNYEFNLIKKENVGDTQKWDMLIGRLKITNSNGITEFDNFSKSDIELQTKFAGFNFQKDLKAYMMYFSGDKLGCIDYGYVYLRIKPAIPNAMSILFFPDNDIATQDCSNFVTTLPTKTLINLIRQ
ncbi:DUF6705 family protein [Chryseobacterium gossypii]|uniref:DUF6705 family protein n=1 Tax=Chryseobacterium gossypii TaxID=3231602 RepID=UPI003524C17E